MTIGEFLGRIEERRPAECWAWRGAYMARGYGQATIKGHPRTGAHRVMWRIAYGRWPEPGKVIMHTCDNPGCVNPAHLREGTQRENLLDASRKGRLKRGNSK